MHLSHEQRHALEVAASAALRSDGIGAIDTLVAQLRRDNPGAFHTDASLRERVFVHQPGADVPCRAFYRPFPAASSRVGW